MYKKLGIGITFIGAYIGLIGGLTWLMCSTGATQNAIGITDWLYGLLAAIFTAVGAAIAFKRPLIGGTITLIVSMLFFVIFGFGLVSYQLFSYFILIGSICAFVGSLIVLFSSDKNKFDIGTAILFSLGIGTILFMILPVVSVISYYRFSGWEENFMSAFQKANYFQIIFGSYAGTTPNALGITAFVLLVVALVGVWFIRFLKKPALRFAAKCVVYAIFIFQLIVICNVQQMFYASNGLAIAQPLLSNGLYLDTTTVSFAVAIPTCMAITLGTAVGIDILLMVFEIIHPFVPRQKTLFDE